MALTIQDLINELQRVPEAERGRSIYVANWYDGDEATGELVEALSISPHDLDKPVSEDNPLALNINPTHFYWRPERGAGKHRGE